MSGKLLEFAKKNWLIIALAIGPPFLLWFFFQRESFALSAKILADVPVVSVRQEYGSKIEVRYRGAAVDRLRVVEVEVENTGTRPLERSAFDSPLTFDFGSARVTDPVLLRSSPNSLKPKLLVGSGSIILGPLLLNPGDRFAFRAFILGGETDSSSITVSGRVRGVTQIGLSRDSDNQFLPGVLSVFGAVCGIVISSVSIARLGLKVSRLTVHLPLGLVVDLTRRLEKDPATAAKSAQLAKELDISRHDAKANLLFLRLRIEAQLRELGRIADLPRQIQLGSIRRLSGQLVQQNFIAPEIASAIDDISPVLNRELHEAETYLSEAEFSSLKRLGLSVIASLAVALEKYQLRPSN